MRRIVPLGAVTESITESARAAPRGPPPQLDERPRYLQKQGAFAVAPLNVQATFIGLMSEQETAPLA